MTELPCPPHMWPRFSCLLDELLDLPEPDRADWLERLGADDTPVKPWLERVLASNTGPKATADFMQPPRAPGGFEDEFTIGSEVGPYRLEAPLGAGGMGVVWRARRQDDGPDREVALKLPHPDMLTGAIRQRFRRERDLLAGLNHPHIAVLYDAGITLHGHPYMALELVQGTPITAYCSTMQAGLARRMELLEQVLDALGYAHQRLIVHRDIKPSNVMVTPEGVVKLLDFGIAKLLQGTETTEMMLTQAVARLATPGYGAPEQISGGEITVAADLFSVGVLGFELCTGVLPFGTGPASDFGQFPLASRRAQSGAAEFQRLAAGLRGDLDAILAKALSLDARQRYVSADAFARDLRRWREGLPVSARKVGWPTLTSKFIRRNPVGVTLAAALFVVFIGGTAGIYWQARRAAAAAVRANTIKDFMVSLFTEGNPAKGYKPSELMTAKELLDIGTDRARSAFAHDPATEIALLETLGDVYDRLTDATRAEEVRSRQLEIARALHGPAAPDVIVDTLRLANTEVLFLNYDKAFALLESIRAPVFGGTGEHSLERAKWLGEHANALRGQSGARDQAIAESQASIAIFAQYFPNDPFYADALRDLSNFQYDAERYDASLAALDRGREVARLQGQSDKMDELMYAANRGSRLEKLGRLDEAAASFTAEARQAEAMTGRNSAFFVHAQDALANLLHLRGERVAADALFAATLADNNAHAASTGGLTALRRAYGAALAREGRPAAAMPLLEQALAETQPHGRDESSLRRTQALLGDCYDQLGRTQQARALLLAARDAWMQFGPLDGAQSLEARERWARFLASQNEAAAAAAEYRAVLHDAGAKASAAAALAQAGLARLALAQGDLAAAAGASQAGMTQIAAATGEYDVRARLDVWMARAAVLRAQGDAAGAKALAGQALALAQLWDAPGSAVIARISGFLAAGAG